MFGYGAGRAYVEIVLHIYRHRVMVSMKSHRISVNGEAGAPFSHRNKSASLPAHRKHNFATACGSIINKKTREIVFLISRKPALPQRGALSAKRPIRPKPMRHYLSLRVACAIGIGLGIGITRSAISPMRIFVVLMARID